MTFPAKHVHGQTRGMNASRAHRSHPLSPGQRSISGSKSPREASLVNGAACKLLGCANALLTYVLPYAIRKGAAATVVQSLPFRGVPGGSNSCCKPEKSSLLGELSNCSKPGLHLFRRGRIYPAVTEQCKSCKHRCRRQRRRRVSQSLPRGHAAPKRDYKPGTCQPQQE